MSNTAEIEVLVIGAGVVGLAIAREFATKGQQVIVAESENKAGSGVSSRNSGVIHAGIYYPKDTLKARLCVEGNKRLYQYCHNKKILHRNCEKFIVACNIDDEAKLAQIKEKASNNGVDKLSWMSREDAMFMEPNLSCTAALRSPTTGIIDIHVYMDALMADIEEAEGIIAFRNKIERIEPLNSNFKVFLVGGETIKAKIVINAAGISAQKVAGNVMGINRNSIPKQYLAKGNYFGISGKPPFSRLIYPVPEQGGLGAHYTMNIAGDSLFGPDVEWLDGSEDTIKYDVDESRADKFYNSISRFFPTIRDKTLLPAYAGIRPKLSGPGEPDADFIIHNKYDHGIEGLICLYGIESPGLTASLAIADYTYSLVT